MRVFLNGNEYVLQNGTQVKRTPLVEWPDNIRLDGQQKRKDRSLLSSWAIDRWSDGLCLERQNVDIPSHDYRIWDADGVDTRHDFGIILSPAFNTCTIVPSRGDLDLRLEYLDQLYFVETTTFGSISTPSGPSPAFSIGRAYRFTPPFTIGSHRDVAPVDTGAGWARTAGSISSIKSFGNNIVAVIKGGVFPSYSVIGSISNRLAVIATLGGTIRIETVPLLSFDNNYSLKSQLGNLGGTLHLLTYDSAKANAGLWLANAVQAAPTLVASLSTYFGTYLSPLQTDGETMYAQFPQGIYDFDLTPAILIDTSRSQEKNPSQVMFGNDLFFKNAKSLINYNSGSPTSAGYDREDGLPAEQMGEITAMCSSWKYIYAAVKGLSYSHILTREAKGAWQYYARVPSMGIWVEDMFLSNSPDAIDRLWCIFGNAVHPGYFLNPMVNPLQAGTYSYVPTGYFTKSIYDGGMAEEPGAFYDQKVTADGITSNVKITSLYGLDGASPVTTLGVVGTTTDVLTFGSPYGVEGYRIQPRFMLQTNNTGTTPIFRNATIHYLKIPDERESFDFTIDLNETAKIRTNPLEAVIGSLNYERTKRTLMPFWYGQIATKNVKVLDMPSLEEITEDRIYQGGRSGFVRVKVAEIL